MLGQSSLVHWSAVGGQCPLVLRLLMMILLPDRRGFFYGAQYFYSIIVGGDNTLSGGGAWTHRAEQRIVQSWQMIMAGWHGPLFDGLWIIFFRILNSFFLSTTIRNKRRSYGRVLDQAVVWQTYTIWSSLDQVFRFSLSHSHRVDRLIQSPHFSSSPNFDWVGWSTREWCKDGGIQLVNHRRVITGTKFIRIHSVAW